MRGLPIRRSRRSAAAGLLCAVALAGCGGDGAGTAPAPGTGEAEEPRPGGRLVVALRAEPDSLNPALAVQTPSLTVIHRIHADLVHINRLTQQTEPALAESWEVSEDGTRYTLTLRAGVRFSDGEPLTTEDVAFSYRVYLDPEVGYPGRDLLIFDGEPIQVRPLDSRSVEFVLPRPAAAGDRLFDSLAILPRHRLERPYLEGRLPETWAAGSDPDDIVGLGPFRLSESVPGERLVLSRNPHYWKRDEAGRQLPYLDELTFLIVPSEDAQAIRFQAGETDVIDRLSAQNFNVLEPEQERRGYRLHDLGPDLYFSFLFFNLNQLAGRDLPQVAAHQEWFQDPAFRRAVAAAIDREAMVRLVYQGRATPLGSIVTPGNPRWAHPELRAPQRSLARARDLLSGAGFRWDAAGRLRDAADRRVEFTVVTNSGNDERTRMMTIVQSDLEELGIEVQAVPLEFRALIDRIFSSFDYETCILGLGGGDADPNPLMNLLLSGGSTHLWRLGESGPATGWEAEIDRLMTAQLTELDPERRAQLFFRVQEIMAEQAPMIPLVSANLLVGARADLGNFEPAILDHPTLWNVEDLFWKSAARRGR